jgi:hypothetical protein
MLINTPPFSQQATYAKANTEFDVLKSAGTNKEHQALCLTEL